MKQLDKNGLIYLWQKLLGRFASVGGARTSGKVAEWNSNGELVPGHSLGKDVPPDAKFTDTQYELSFVSTSTAEKTGAKITLADVLGRIFHDVKFTAGTGIGISTSAEDGITFSATGEPVEIMTYTGDNNDIDQAIAAAEA